MQVQTSGNEVRLRSKQTASPRRMSRMRGQSPVRLGKLGRCLASFRDFCEAKDLKRKRRAGCVAAKTARDRRQRGKQAIRILHRKGMKVQSVHNLRAKHFDALMEHVETADYEPGTRQDWVSFLRWLAQELGLREVERRIVRRRWKMKHLMRRTYVAKGDRSLLPTGVSFDEVFQRVYAIEPWVAACLLLMHAFALRTKEAMLFRPWDPYDEEGRIHIEYGTKGGRPRTHERPVLSKVYETAVLAFARLFAASKTESMIPRGMEFKHAYARFYYVMRKAGFTRAKVGRTPHALRHGRLQGVFKAEAGFEPSTRGGCMEADPERACAAADRVSNVAGHKRRWIATAYVGRYAPPRRRRTNSPDRPDTQAWTDGPSQRESVGAADVSDPTAPLAGAVGGDHTRISEHGACGCATNDGGGGVEGVVMTRRRPKLTGFLATSRIKARLNTHAGERE